MELRARLKNGDVLFGGWAVTGSAASVDALSLAGADYVCLDQQHGELPAANFDHLLLRTLIGKSHAVVRVPDDSVALVQHVLDQGAEGIVAPQIDDGGQAAAFASYCRFPPAGVRSYGGRTRGVMRFDGDPRAANDGVAVIAMVESRGAIQHIDEICAVPEIDGVYIGLSDLALSLGLGPGMSIRPGIHAEAVQHVANVARRHSVAWGTHATGAVGDQLVDMGAQLVTACSDLALVEAGAATAFRQRSAT